MRRIDLMRVIVPLAGPDFVSDAGQLKALLPLRDGSPLLKSVLASRAWARSVRPSDYAFIMIDRPETRKFAAAELAEWFPGASVTYLSGFTRGAAFSALAGIAGEQDPAKPIVIDLADIRYKTDFEPIVAFDAAPSCGGIALTFPSSNPVYSYLKFDPAGVFEMAAEKRVISGHASAGTYFFRSTAVYLRALSHVLEEEPQGNFKGNFFICPLFNGVKRSGWEVQAHTVSDVFDIKIFKP